MRDVIRLWQFTDPHLFADPDGEIRGARTYDTLKQAIKTAQSSGTMPDGIIVTGDIAQDESRAAYRLFRESFANLGSPVFCLPGNHDNPGYMQELLDEPPFQYCGTAGFGNWLVPLLDTHTHGDAGGRLEQAELDRLSAALSANPDRHFLICLHHHPVPSGSRWLDTVALRNAAELWEIVERHQQVRCLLWGHVHQEYEDRVGEVLLLSTPSTCSQFLPMMETFTLDKDRPPAYRWLDLRPDGTIATSVKWCARKEPA